MIRLTLGLAGLAVLPVLLPAAAPGAHKVRDVVIYSDDRFHCAFPSMVRRPDGIDLVVAAVVPLRLRCFVGFEMRALGSTQHWRDGTRLMS